ncbi:MAG: PilZ domain-containing protein [Chloroflexota bacterium]
MADRKRTSWIQRLGERLLGQSTSRADVTELAQYRPVDATIVPEVVDEGPATASRTLEHWRDLAQQGQRVTLTWDGGPQHGSLLAEGEVRLTFDETVWVWLDQELPEQNRPVAGQAIQLLTPQPDGLRLIPCRLVEATGGASLQVAISGRVSRIQRRDDVRMPVDLPPISAVRLSLSGKPTGLLGLQAVDLSAGGIRVRGQEMLRAGERLRIVLRLDDDEPLTPVVQVVVPGQTAHGRFERVSETERRRIVQYVYRQELAERRRARTRDDATLADPATIAD